MSTSSWEILPLRTLNFLMDPWGKNWSSVTDREMKEKEVKGAPRCQKTNTHDGQLRKEGEAVWGRKVMSSVSDTFH